MTSEYSPVGVSSAQRGVAVVAVFAVVAPEGEEASLHVERRQVGVRQRRTECRSRGALNEHQPRHHLPARVVAGRRRQSAQQRSEKLDVAKTRRLLKEKKNQIRSRWEEQ